VPFLQERSARKYWNGAYRVVEETGGMKSSLGHCEKAMSQNFNNDTQAGQVIRRKAFEKFRLLGSDYRRLIESNLWNCELHRELRPAPLTVQSANLYRRWRDFLLKSANRFESSSLAIFSVGQPELLVTSIISVISCSTKKSIVFRRQCISSIQGYESIETTISPGGILDDRIVA